MYTPPAAASPAQVGGPDGYSYGAVILPADQADHTDLLHALGDIRFSGWLSPPHGGTVVVLGDPGHGVVADGRRGIIEVGELLARLLPGPILAARVLHDRQLSLVAWRTGEEVARYCSDPSIEPDSGRDVLSEPVGTEYAPALAELWHRPDAGERLLELLEEELDPDSVYESERLGSVLRLLGLPAWIVAAGTLPRRMPTGPRPAELIRLRAGATGVAGRAADALIGRLRRRQHPPAVIADPPVGSGMDELWMF